MTKSQCERELETRTAESHHWHKIAAERGSELSIAKAEIAELRQQLELQQIDARALGVGAMQQYREDIKRLIAERDKARAYLVELVQLYKQLDIIVHPERFRETINQIRAMSEDELAQIGAVHIPYANSPIDIAYMVVARSYGENEEVVLKQDIGIYFGTMDELIEETERFHQIIYRMPMPENLRGAMDYTFNIPKEVQLKAIQLLSFYWHDDELRDEFEQPFDHIFKSMIAPLVKPREEQDARKAFLKSFKDTLAEERKNRSIREDAPHLPAGRRKRSDITRK